MKKVYKLVAVSCQKSILLCLLFGCLAASAQESMRANLYAIDANGSYLMDGNLTDYSSTYSNSVDIYDAWKMTNPGINFGILRSGYNLVIERRSIIGSSDTTFFKMWNMSRANYSIKLMLKNLNRIGMSAVIKDNYLHTVMPVALNDTTDYKFTVDTDPASADEMRFQLIYTERVFAPVKISFTTLRAQRKGADALIQWEVEDEQSLESYMIERSADGINFNNLNEVAPHSSSTKTYNYTDVAVSKMDNYYRIKTVGTGNKIEYSKVVKISEIISAPDLSIYPNPVMNKTAQLKLNRLPAGKYAVVLISNNGMQQPLPSLQFSEGQVNGIVNLPQSIAPGVYRLQFIGPSNERIIKTINIL